MNVSVPSPVYGSLVLGKSLNSFGLASSLGGYYVLGGVSSRTSFYALPSGWHHAALTYDGSSLQRLYLDGVLVNQSSAASYLLGEYTNLIIAKYLSGSIDEVRIYNRSLSAQEIWLHYQSEFQKYNSTTYRFYSNLTNLTSGTYTYYGWANDTAGNAGYTNTYTGTSPRYLFVDWTAPVVTLAAPGNNTVWGSSSMVNFTFNVTDASNISFCNLSINGLVNMSNTTIVRNVNQSFNTSLANGNYNWSVNCTDAGGNNGYSGKFNVSVNVAAAPGLSVYLNTPANQTVTSNATPAFNYTVNGTASTYSCTLYLNNTPYGTNASTVNNTASNITANASLSDGVHSWYVNCTSGSTTNMSWIRTLTVDASGPVVGLVNPGNNTEWTSSSLVVFTYNVSDDSAVSYCNLSINGVVNMSNATVTKGVNQTFNVSMANGLYNWSVNCTDVVGNNGFSGVFNVSVGFSFGVYLGSPGNQSLTSDNTPDFNYSVNGTVSMYSCVLFVNDTGYGMNLSTLNNTWTVITANATLGDGVYSWYVNCSAEGVTGQSDIRTVTVDSAPPGVSLMNPGNNTAWTLSNMVNYTYNVTDASNVSYCNLSINGVVNQSNGTIMKGVNQTFNVSLSDGLYNWSVNCTDAAGNNNSSAFFNVLVQSLPDLSAGNLSYNSSSVRERDNVSFNLSVSNDNVQNVSGVNVSFSVDQVLNDSVLINLSINSSVVVNFSWIASPGLHNLSFAVDANNAYSESNESNNNVTVVLNASRVVVVNLSSPLNDSAYPRGRDVSGEDVDSSVGNYLNVSARVYNLYNTSEGVSASCTFFWDNISVGVYPTNADGVCNMSLDKSGNETGLHSLSVSFAGLPSGYVKHTADVEKTYNVSLLQYLTALEPGNMRTNGKYMRGDAAILDVTFTRNGTLYDPSSILVLAKSTSGETKDAHTYPGDVVKITVGKYYSKTIIDSDYDMIHWHVYVNDSESYLSGAPYGSNVTVSGAAHEDVNLDAATAVLNVTVSNGTYRTLGSTVYVYDRNNYLLESKNITPADAYLSRDAALYDLYTVNVTASTGERVLLRGVNLTSQNVNVTPQVVPNYSGYMPSMSRNLSSVVALNASLFALGNATIILPMSSLRIDYIYHCTNWVYSNGSCSSWERNNTGDYGFASNATHFWFTVNSFTAYAGGTGYNSNLTVWDDTDSVVRYFTQQVWFYANYTNVSGSPVNGSGVYCSFRENSSGSWSTPVNMSFNVSSRLYGYNRSFVAAGVYSYNVSCFDVLGGYDNLSAVDAVSISSDVFAPNLSVVSPTPANGTYLLVNYSYVNVSVVDEVGVSACLLEWNNTNESMALVGSGQSVSCYKNKSDSEGTYAYKVYANDTSGNFGVSAGRVVTFDLTKPTIRNVSLGSDPVLGNASVGFFVNVSDNVNVSAVWVSVVRPDGVGNLTLNYSGLYVATFADTSYQGVYAVTVYANDTAGNVNESSVNFTVASCLVKSDCGSDDYAGANYCFDNDVYGMYRTYSCASPRTVDASCSYSEAERLRGDCGSSTIVQGSPYCQDNNVYRDVLTILRGCDTSTLDCYTRQGDQSRVLVEVCGAGYACSNGSCMPGGTTPSTATTSTTTATTSTTVPAWPCNLPGDMLPCGVVTIQEVLEYINLWSQQNTEIGDVMQLINAWTNPETTTTTTTTPSASTTTTTTTSSTSVVTTTTTAPSASTTTTTTAPSTSATTTTTVPGTSTTTTTSTTVPAGPCDLPGDMPPCGKVTPNEIYSYIDEWRMDRAVINDVLRLITYWGYNPANTTSTTTTSMP